MEAARVFVTVGADLRQLHAGLAAASAEVKGFAGRMGAVGASTAAAGASLTRSLTVPIVGVVAAAGKMALGFEKSMTDIRALVGASEQQMKDYEQQVLDMAKTMPQSPKELADALYYVTSAGFEGAEAISVLEASAQAAAAGLGDTKVVADTVTSAVNAYGGANLSASDATDVLLATVREGKAEPEALAAAFGRVIAPAQAMGVEFDEVGAGLASLTLTGLDAAEAATGLRSILSTVMDPSKAARDTLAEVGISVDDLRESVADKGLMPAMQNLRDTFGNNQDALAALFPNVRALNAFLALTGENADKNAGIFDELADSTGATATAFGEAMKDNGNRIKSAWSTIQVAMGRAGGVITPVFATLAEKAAQLVEWFSGLSSSTKKWIGIAVGVVAAVGPIVLIVGKLIGLLGVLTAAVGFLISPVGLVVVAVAALVAGLVLLYQHSETFRQIVGQVADALRAALGAALDFARDKFGQVAASVQRNMGTIRQTITTVLNAIKAVWQAVWPWLETYVRTAWEGIKRVIDAAIKVIGGVIKTVMAVIRGDWSAAWDGIKQVVSGIWDGIKAIVGTGLKQVAHVLDGLLGILKTLAFKAWQKAQEVGKGILDGIKNVLTGLVGKVSAAFQKLWEWIAGAASTAFGWAKKIGKAIVEGIWKGIEDAWGWLEGKLGDFAGWVQDHTLGLFGINSPARVMIPVGTGIAEGIAVGIGKGAGLVRAAIARVASSSVRAASSSFRSGGASPAGDLIGNLLAEAKRFLGTPYLYGSAAGRSYFGASPSSFDCSGFVSYLYKRVAGVAVGAFTGEWAKQGKAVPKGMQQAGDAVLFGDPNSGKGGHMGMMLDQFRFIHASSSGGVKISDLRTYGREAVAFRRVLGDANRTVQDIGDGVDAVGGKLARAAERAKAAWDKMAQNASAAFDRATDRMIKNLTVKVQGAFGAFEYREGALTPTEQRLRDEENARAEADRQRQLADARRQLAEAKTADERADAQRAVADALWEIERAGLERQAEEERTAADAALEAERRELEDRRAIQKEHFDAALARLLEHLAAGKIGVKEANKQLRRIFKQAGIDWQTAGSDLGSAFSKGLLGSIRDAMAQAGALAQPGGSPAAPASPTTGGGWDPSKHASFLVTAGRYAAQVAKGKAFQWGGYFWGRNIGHGLDAFTAFLASKGGSVGDFKTKHKDLYALLGAGGIVTGPTRAIVGEAGPEAVIPLSRRGLDRYGLDGGGDVHLHFHGPVMSDRAIDDVAEKVRKALLRTQRRNGQLGFT